MTHSVLYRDFELYYEPPPIADRGSDWHAFHKDDNVNFHGLSIEDLKQQIDDWYEEQS